MNLVFYAVAAVSSVASLVTAIYGIYFREGGTRMSLSSRTAEISRIGEAQGRAQRLSSVAPRDPQ